MIWLPPSEGKTPPGSGPRLDLTSLSQPTLLSPRTQVLEALGALGTGQRAATVLGLGPRSASQAMANAVIQEAPCARADDLFTGVLFAAADFASMDAAARERAHALVLVFSGLFGAVRLDDLLPDHRLPMGTILPGPGRLSTFWRSPLRGALEPLTGTRVVLDLRSGPYRAACPAPWARVLRLGVEREHDGRRFVVSHDAKTWRGLVCGALLRAGDLPDDEGGALEALVESARGITSRDARGRRHHVVDLDVGPAVDTREGGSVRDVVLVTD